MGIPLTATLADADGGVTGTTWQWSSADTASGTFADISGATSATYRPAEADLEKYLKATAAYTDSLDAGKSASATTASAVTVVDRVLVDNISNLQMHQDQRGRGGNHPAGTPTNLSGVPASVTFDRESSGEWRCHGAKPNTVYLHRNLGHRTDDDLEQVEMQVKLRHASGTLDRYGEDVEITAGNGYVVGDGGDHRFHHRRPAP